MQGRDGSHSGWLRPPQRGPDQGRDRQMEGYANRGRAVVGDRADRGRGVQPDRECPGFFFLSLLKRVVRYFDDPEHFDCPLELTLSRYMGDSRMLVAGGILDQPIGLYMAAQSAGYIYQQVERF